MNYELQINTVIARIIKEGGDTAEGCKDAIVAEIFGGDVAATNMFADYIDYAVDLANRIVGAN